MEIDVGYEADDEHDDDDRRGYVYSSSLSSTSDEASSEYSADDEEEDTDLEEEMVYWNAVRQDASEAETMPIVSSEESLSFSDYYERNMAVQGQRRRLLK
eukprot:gene13593-15004_t